MTDYTLEEVFKCYLEKHNIPSSKLTVEEMIEHNKKNSVFDDDEFVDWGRQKAVSEIPIPTFNGQAIIDFVTDSIKCYGEEAGFIYDYVERENGYVQVLQCIVFEPCTLEEIIKEVGEKCQELARQVMKAKHNSDALTVGQLRRLLIDVDDDSTVININGKPVLLKGSQDDTIGNLYLDIQN